MPDADTTTTTTNVGDTPVSAPASFSLVAFPYVLWKAAAQAAYADTLGGPDGDADAREAAMAEAGRLLDFEITKIERQMGATRPLSVVNADNCNQYSG